jgi:threonine/homoserine/homoserine lactone efflux protein
VNSTLLAALLAGLAVGVPAGLTPGPLMTLVISQTLRHGPREGAVIAASPLLTDLPIIAVSFILLGSFAGVDWLLGLLSVIGGVYILWLARETWRSGPVRADAAVQAPRSWRRGALVNLLNPNPYLFWGTVGVPYMLRHGGAKSFAAWSFALAFFLCLVGGKVTIAWLVGRSRHLLEGRRYQRVMQGLAVGLVLFALLLVRDGLRLLGGAP